VNIIRLLTHILDSNFLHDLRLLASIYLAELSIMLMPMAIYMKGERPFGVFLSSKPGMVFLLAIAVSVITGVVIVRQYRISKLSRSSHFLLMVKMNLVTALLVVIITEITLRISSQSSKDGETVGSTVLKPKNWEKVALWYKKFADRASGPLSYLVYDDFLGWTLGPNRRSADGLYQSSSEGIRAHRAGVSFAEFTGGTRIALVGDSFTFGNEVPYEDSWGYRLQQALGPNFQVLNFGVGGYSVGQAYLRYEKDVRRWNPQIVIFGFIAHDLMRTMTVYPFLAFPEWDIPFSKPRYILRDGDLKIVNVPPLAPEAIFSRGSIFELPHLQYEVGFKEDDWKKSLKQVSYMARLFVSQFPRWSPEHPDVTDEALVSVNASILKTFVRSVAETGAIPIVVYFPSGREVKAARHSSPAPISQQVLQEASVAYTDLTPCLMELDPTDRLAPSGAHYSPQGNAAVANCLRDVVDESLAVPSFGG
jgi:hypothetical protein